MVVSMSDSGEIPQTKILPNRSAPLTSEHVDELANDFVQRWQRGERVPAEAYLNRHSNLVDDDAFELVLTEVVLRQEYGEPPSLEEFSWRFPHFAERLQRHFALHASLVTHVEGDGSTAADTVKPPVPSTLPPSSSPTIPGFELLEELGRGGMGVVYRAREVSLGRDVAIKFLPAEYSDDSVRLERFKREARTASALNHPNICTVHALDEHDGRRFIVMELVEGQTLHAINAQRPPITEIAQHMRQAAGALASAHAAGVVHRDIKPENIMVRPDGYVKVLDFGLARRLPALEPGAIDEYRTTSSGAILGTVAYMSPEQTRGDAAETASDIFSLGIILYQLVTGQHPFESGSAWETLHAISALPATPVNRLNPVVPAALAQLTEAMLHKDPLLRPTAEEVETSLQSILSSTGRCLAPTAAVERVIVQRKPELAALRSAFDKADAGTGSVSCLAGEPGIGKTTLVEDFFASLAADERPCWIGRGHCSERLADTEAYLPVIDALEDLLRGDKSGTVARLMQLVAPTWYAYVRPAATPRTLEATAPQGSKIASGSELTPPIPLTRASSQQAMLREFYNLIQEVSRLGPVVLLFDDVHWADVSTVDLIAYLGRHCQRLRLLILVTYRPTELLLGPHPFHRAKLELLGSGACTEHVIGFLSRDDIRDYLEIAFPQHELPPDFTELIHQATEGSPLFMADLLRYLRERGVISNVDGRWTLTNEAFDLRQNLPDSILSMIQRKLDLLSEDDRKLLSTASVQGQEFDSAAVAGALERDAADVEERLGELDRVHGLVRLSWEDEFADGTVTLRYVFVHALYQQALYTALQPSRRAAMGIALARTLERLHGSGNAAPAELACLCEVGRDYAQAAKNFWLAAQDAASVFAHREAVVLARRGLRMLENLPETFDRCELELPLQTTLGMQLQVTNGFAAREARQAYDRARQLCRQVPDSGQLFPVLWGLWLYSKVRSELGKAQEMADELLDLAQRLRAPDLALQAYQALGMTAFCRGIPSETLQHVEQATALYDRDRHHAHADQFGQDPGVICKAFGAVALWILGYPDEARRQSDAAIQMSLRLSPSSQAVALHFAAMLHQLCRDPARVSQFTKNASEIAAEHGFSFWQAGSSVLGGWALASSGSLDAGLNCLRQGLLDWNATNSMTYRTYYLGLLADVLRQRGDVAESLRVIEEGLTLVEQSDERLYEAELHRLRGELRLPDDRHEAEEHFYKSLTVARHQGARSFELRTATSLAALHASDSKKSEARKLLLDAMEKIAEGPDTRDLQEAKRILENL